MMNRLNANSSYFLMLPLVILLIFQWLQRDRFVDQIQRGKRAQTLRNDPERNARNLVQSGRKLSPKEVERFEKRAQEGELSEGGRTRLIGYYAKSSWRNREAQSALARHVLWFVENRPRSPVLSSTSATLEPRRALNSYLRAKELWVQWLEESPDNLSIKSNAASMFLFGDRDLSIEILREAEAMDPDNGEWAKRLGYAHKLNMATDSRSQRLDAATLSLNAYERAYPNLSELERAFVEDDLATLAYDTGDEVKAKYYSEMLIELPEPGALYSYGNQAHVGRIILGLLALDNGKIELAKEELLSSVTFPTKVAESSPVSLSQVDYRLALRLLAEGETESVREFLEKGRPHFRLDEGKVPEWLDTLEDGLVPNFEGI